MRGKNLLLYLISLFLIILFSTYIKADEEIDGYRGAKWGMGVKEVKKVIRQIGLEFTETKIKDEKGVILKVNDKIFGYKAEIQYWLEYDAPEEIAISKEQLAILKQKGKVSELFKQPHMLKLTMVDINIESLKPFNLIRSTLNKKYGKPISAEKLKELFGIWLTSKTEVMLGKNTESIFIIYRDIKEVAKYYLENMDKL